MTEDQFLGGTRAESPQAPVAYEIPREVVAEAIVNAVAHRDYSSNGSVQVMLFADRLEVWNPGGLPPSLTLARLRLPHGSVPANPLLAEPLYLTRYIERMGTGTRDMIRRCREAGLGGSAQSVTGEVTGEVKKLVLVCRDSMSRKALQNALSLSGEDNFRTNYLVPALKTGVIEMTLPDKPKSSQQKYRLSLEGKKLQASLLRTGKA